jgi:hypothetical protein
MAKRQKSPDEPKSPRKPTLEDAIQFLRDTHTVNEGLRASASLEQRALKQVRDQEYQSVIIRLEAYAKTNGNLGGIPAPEATYEDEE